MAPRLVAWVMVSFIFFSQLGKSACSGTLPKPSFGELVQYRPSSSHSISQSTRHEIPTKHSIGESTHKRKAPTSQKLRPRKSWSMPMTRMEDHEARQNPHLNKSNIQQWEEMVMQSHARQAYLYHRSNRIVDIEAWDLPRMVRGEWFTVDIEMGSPPQTMTFIVDTGSDFVWMQSEPCNPRMNSPHNPYPVATQDSFVRNVKCAEDICEELDNFATCDPSSQLDEDCTFHYQYGDETDVFGIMSIDTINYNNDGIDESTPIHLGMANDVRDSVSREYDGVLGLARSALGLSFQLKSEFDNVFSHCFVNPDSGGKSKFTMGAYPSALSQHLVFTPMKPINPIYYMNHHYYVTLQAIEVGGLDLGIDPSVFAQTVTGDYGAGGTVIDTGSSLTYIPEVAFTAVVNAYRRQVTIFPVVSRPLYRFCFDTTLSVSTTPPILPELTFNFANGADLVVTSAEAFKSLDAGTLLCLAMDWYEVVDGEFSIIGSIFMQNQYVVYDNTHNNIGFAPWNCLSV